VRPFRIIHVDDDPLIRDVVELSLGYDPAFVVLSCESADTLFSVVTEWAPDLILCDLLMPGINGLTLLTRLRERPNTAKIPVIFITAHARKAQRDELMALGAVAVIAKPFLPMTLANTVRRHLVSIKMASAGFDFTRRLRSDADKLAAYRDRLRNGPDASALPEELESLVHKLAGAAGIFDFRAVSSTASALEDAIIDRRAGRGVAGSVEANLDALLASIERV
jgi:two-component system, OmpR family, response regulator